MGSESLLGMRRAVYGAKQAILCYHPAISTP